MDEQDVTRTTDEAPTVDEIKSADEIGTMFSEDVEGTWFKYDENNPNSAEICLRNLKLEEINEMERLFSKKKVVFKKFGRYEFAETNSDKQNEYVWTHAIMAWKKVLDGKGKLRPCNEEHILYLMYKVPSFSRWVSKSMRELNALEAELEETELKNL